jgi:hypothetical protein
MKHVITTSATLETAVVMSVSNDWWEQWASLDALHLWADFAPEPPFQQLTLSFIIPKARQLDVHDLDFDSGFERKMETIVGPHGDQQLLAHIILGKVLINHIYVYDNININWEETLRIRRRVVDGSIGRVYWHTWDPFESERL